MCRRPLGDLDGDALSAVDGDSDGILALAPIGKIFVRCGGDVNDQVDLASDRRGEGRRAAETLSSTGGAFRGETAVPAMVGGSAEEGDEIASSDSNDLMVAADQIREVVESARALGLKDITFDQVMTFIEAKREYQARAYSDTEAVDKRRQEQELLALERQIKLDADEREARARERSQERSEKRIIEEARLRAILALVVVAGMLTGVLYGLFYKVAAQDLTQYLAPMTGLAGIVVGYFFGREYKS